MSDMIATFALRLQSSAGSHERAVQIIVSPSGKPLQRAPRGRSIAICFCSLVQLSFQVERSGSPGSMRQVSTLSLVLRHHRHKCTEISLLIVAAVLVPVRSCVVAAPPFAISSSDRSWRIAEEAGTTPEYRRVFVHLEAVFNSKTPVSGRGSLTCFADGSSYDLMLDGDCCSVWKM